MSNHYSKKRRLKYVLLAAACTVSFTLTGLAAACSEPEDGTDNEKTTSREDTQLLKNGNFEFFDVPTKSEDDEGNDPVYLINTPNNWSHGGTTPYTMSGIIGTSEAAWAKLADEELADKLDYNNELDSSASDYKDLYVDYNGMKSSDILYANTWAALNEEDIENPEELFGIYSENGKYYFNLNGEKTEVYLSEGKDDANDVYYLDAEFTKPVAKALIANPETHYNVHEKNGSYYYYDGNNEEKPVYVDEDGDYYFSYNEDTDEYSDPFSHVLMLHNYSSSTKSGITQNYASLSVDLPANTAAEISVWVKTSNLIYLNTENKLTGVVQDRGANITVTHTVGSSTLDNFSISCINTEKLLSGAEDKYNGWVEYTVYINACDFASGTVTIELGLGNDFPVSGYAFFDDVTVTKYTDLSASSCTYSQYEAEINRYDAKCTLSSDASMKIFPVDTYQRNGKVDPRYSGCRHFLLDLASESAYDEIIFGSNVKASVTADSDNYVSAMNVSGVTKLGFGSIGVADEAKLPDELKNLKVNGVSGLGLDTSNDLVAYVTSGANSLSSISNYKYYDRLQEELKTAADLPKADNFSSSDKNVLVMLSEYGAAYTVTLEGLTVEKEGYKIISFWVKTSDMNGNPAATVKITDADNEDNSVSLNVDTTGVTTDIDDDNEDIFNGWVQCFFFVNNEDDTAKTLNLEFSFGNTTIGGTSITSYKAGWVALANMQTLDVDEDTFGYTTSGSYTASLTISEDDESNAKEFDEVYGNQKHEIANGIVNPSSYSGVNGGSSSVVNNGTPSNPYDEINHNPNAGLINKDYIENYSSADWYNTILNSFLGVNYSATDALANWNSVFGNNSVQPLVIINGTRDSYVEAKGATADTYSVYYIKNEDGQFVKVNSLENHSYDENETYYDLKQVLNYGFIGNAKTVSANSYETVSVKVKVSAGAVAYIYLVDTAAGKNVLGFTTPAYSFYYDEDGNVLKGEIDENASVSDKRANILYTLRTDGLYQDKEGNLYANLYNYTKVYTDSNANYFDKNGVAVSFDNLVDGETYYSDSAMTTIANHYLANTSGVKLYEYIDGKYYYIVNGETQSDEILPFDTNYARPDYFAEEQYKVVLDARYDANGKLFNENGAGEAGYDKNGNKVAGEWFTVTFVIHSGSESKSYRLELWSGERESNLLSDGATSGAVGSTIIFDYSYSSISDDTLRDYYEAEIIEAYQRLLVSNGITNFATSEENISYYEKLVADNNVTVDYNTYPILKDYVAHYYTYSLYDSANYRPFNQDVAEEGETGYDYSLDSYSEALAYLKVTDGNAYTVFTDYSTVDQSISMNTADSSDDDDSDDGDDDTSVWLLVSSILLVVALLFAMIAILIKDTVKKLRRKQVLANNNYNHKKANRYIRKLHIKKEEIEEVDSLGSEDAQNDESEAVESAEPENGQSDSEPAEKEEPENANADDNSEE